ncbi:aminoglycoside phosphotransferase family protein [Vibrio parahaemolyticus]|nr:aminoglycoside phosphotransferase family protein [Vibrio parahaemolyticus]
MDEFTWLKTKLGHNKEITDLHEIHSTPFGKVVRVRSGDELFYFKTDDLLRFEAEKTEYVSRRFCRKTPDFIDYCREKRWFLVRGAGSEVLHASLRSDWRNAIVELANFHKAKVKTTDFEVLPIFEFDTSVWHDFVKSSQYLTYWGLTEQEQADLNSISNRLTSYIDVLSESQLKPKICHGDAHARNVLVDQHGHISWFDWSSAHLGNPLGDLGFFLWWLTPDRTKIGIGVELGLDDLESLSHSYQTQLFGGVKYDNLKCLMSFGLAYRAMLYHKIYYPVKDFKPFYVAYTLKQLLKLSATT